MSRKPDDARTELEKYTGEARQAVQVSVTHEPR
jgi:hypothetical protein